MIEAIKAEHTKIKARYHAGHDLYDQFVQALGNFNEWWGHGYQVAPYKYEYRCMPLASAYSMRPITNRPPVLITVIFNARHEVWLEIWENNKQTNTLVTSFDEATQRIAPVVAVDLFARGMYNWK